MLEWIQSNQIGRNEMLYRDKTVSKVRNWLSLGCRIYWFNATIERDTVIYDFDQIKTCLDIHCDEFLELWEKNFDWYFSQTQSKCKILRNESRNIDTIILIQKIVAGSISAVLFWTVSILFLKQKHSATYLYYLLQSYVRSHFRWLAPTF